MLKRHLKNIAMDVNTWEKDALDQNKYHSIVEKSIPAIEEKRQIAYVEAHKRRHSMPDQSTHRCNHCRRYCWSNAILLAHKRACQKWTQKHSQHRCTMNCRRGLCVCIKFGPLLHREPKRTIKFCDPPTPTKWLSPPQCSRCGYGHASELTCLYCIQMLPAVWLEFNYWVTL